jgi:hypothetical protein
MCNHDHCIPSTRLVSHDVKNLVYLSGQSDVFHQKHDFGCIARAARNRPRLLLPPDNWEGYDWALSKYQPSPILQAKDSGLLRFVFYDIDRASVMFWGRSFRVQVDLLNTNPFQPYNSEVYTVIMYRMP